MKVTLGFRELCTGGAGGIILLIASSLLAASPVVDNVRASQRPGTGLVDIYFDLSDADGDLQTIEVAASGDGGLTYTIPCVTLSGAVGSGVTLGTGKHIVWNAEADWGGNYVADSKVRVTAQGPQGQPLSLEFPWSSLLNS